MSGKHRRNGKIHNDLLGIVIFRMKPYNISNFFFSNLLGLFTTLYNVHSQQRQTYVCDNFLWLYILKASVLDHDKTSTYIS